jgi:S-adenosylmethionine-diacylglycerol 3-amino-3-carboxypropyl transferase
MSLSDWIGGKIFRYVHGSHLIYNTCWEDPRLDRVAMNLRPADNVLVITSAGCNALDYALAGPNHVYAVDLNPRQNALLDLKIAGIRTLDHDTFFQLFGRGRHADFAGLYQSTLRHFLPEASREYWDKHPRLFSGGRRQSFYFRGTCGLFAWMFNHYIDKVAKVRDAIELCLMAPTLHEQQAIYQEQIAPRLWKKPLQWSLRRDTTMSLLGVPRPQKHQIDREYDGGMPGFIRDNLAVVFGQLPLQDNYFWRVYLHGQYTQNCCPSYLTKDGFYALKAGAVDKVTTHTNSVAGFLENNDVNISRFVLLDHQDWLSNHNGGVELSREWSAIAKRATKDARVLYRSAGTTSDFIDRTTFTHEGKSRPIGEILRYNKPQADELHKIDRVHTYGSFYIADLAV